MSGFFAVLKFLAFVFLTLLLAPLQWVVVSLYKGRYSYTLPRLWHKGACAIFGVRIEQNGKPYTQSQVIYVGNHLSYMDIPVLGSIIPGASFVSKNDVRQWPVWGFLSKLQQTAFISRARKDTQAEAGSLDAMIAGGKNLIIFPEGTTTNGANVLDFKSSLFSLMLKNKDAALMIQPFTLEIISTNGKVPETADERNIYAWPVEVEAELHEHLWALAKSSGARIRVSFHDVLQTSAFEDRKTLAKTCHEAVCKGMTLSKAA